MKSEQLRAYQATNFLSEGHPEVLEKLRPAFAQLIRGLEELPGSSSTEQKLARFEQAMQQINEYESEIETVERETILQAIYALGQIVGLDPASRFAERWRGDW